MYIGRFAPSPTGPLHAGSLVAALASWLDARAHGGKWLVRIEDTDTPRCIEGAAAHILWQLAQCSLIPDESVVYQSQRSQLYDAALQTLQSRQLVYACTCSRQRIATHYEALGVERDRFTALPYPGFCRETSAAGSSRAAWRLLSGSEALSRRSFESNPISVQIFTTSDATDLIVTWQDRVLGTQQQTLNQEVGDFILKRADGIWAYQLAVVVDDAAQGVTHVVRGQDLADNTARQIWLQHCLGLPTPQYLHTPLVLAPDGQKLSKQSGAKAVNVSSPQTVLQTLQDAALALGLHCGRYSSEKAALADWLQQWQAGPRTPLPPKMRP